MAIVWPSAGRAYDLLEAAQHNIEANRLTISTPQDSSNERSGINPSAQKRRAESDIQELHYRSQFDDRDDAAERLPATESIMGALGHSFIPDGRLDNFQPRPRPPPLSSHPYAHGAYKSPDQRLSTDYTAAAQGLHQDLYSQPSTGSQQSHSSWTEPSAPYLPGSYPTFTASGQSTASLSLDMSTRPQYEAASHFADNNARREHHTSARSESMFPAGTGSDEDHSHLARQPQDPYHFQPQTALPTQHSQSLWNGYSDGTADPFGDPSTLSASLYNVPLIPEGQRNPLFRQQPYMLSTGMPISDGYPAETQSLPHRYPYDV